MKAMIFMNRWEFALTSDDNVNLLHKNRYRYRDGWVNQHCEGSNLYISRNQANGKYVLSISDDGKFLLLIIVRAGNNYN